MGYAFDNKLTPEQMKARKERREKIVAAVACPTCNQPAGHNCIGNRKGRRAMHSTRIAAFKLIK